MLDAGIQLEPERARLVQALSQTAPDQWRPEDVQRLKEGMDPAISGIPQKRIFGSDYPYRDAVRHLSLSCDMSSTHTIIENLTGKRTDEMARSKYSE